MWKSKANRRVAAIVFGTLIGIGILLVTVVWPGYQNPVNRTYTSRFGYASLRRAAGQPFPVKTALAEKRTMVNLELAEGVVATTPIIASMATGGTVSAVHVREGDVVSKGQLIAEIDAAKAKTAVGLAQLTLQSAEAELERVKRGSTPSTVQERPERDAINLEANRKRIELLREQIEANRKLYEQGIISKTSFLQSQAQLLEAERQLDVSELSLDVSSTGQSQSLAIAQNHVEAAKWRLELRQDDLKQCKVYAPASGVVEKVLLHPGEHSSGWNQPAVVIASGLWFEGRLDQKAINKVQVGDPAEVELEAIGGTLRGKVARIVRVVSYRTGGPEMSRPIRPIGTGAPQWPATFPVEIELSPEDLPALAPGLTGFARIRSERTHVAVPQGAITSFSAGRGIVHTLSEGTRSLRPVTAGSTWKGWTEIVSGVSAGETVIVEGHESLEAHDQVAVTGPSVSHIR